MICSLGTDMEKGSALCFECQDSLMEAFKEGALLKAFMLDKVEEKDWEEDWQLQGDAFLSDTGKTASDLESLVQHLDQYAYGIEVFLDGKLIGFVRDI